MLCVRSQELVKSHKLTMKTYVCAYVYKVYHMARTQSTMAVNIQGEGL